MTDFIRAKFNEVKDKVSHLTEGELKEGERLVHGYAVFGPNQPLKPWSYVAKPLGPKDVEIKISYCGVCHTDITCIDDKLGMSSYPFIPGHEIIGTITKLGSDVDTDHVKLGQRVGVGFFKRSCHSCNYCMDGKDNLCLKAEPTLAQNGANGGWANYIRVDSEWAFPIPDAIPSDQAAPLLCAGITVFSPLQRSNLREGSKVAIMGLGGLGHLYVKMAAVMGCEVWVLSASPNKEQEAYNLGAAKFVDMNDKAKLKELTETFDLLLSTMYETVDWAQYFDTVKADGTFCLVGWSPVEKPIQAPVYPLVYRQRKLIGSNVGSTWQTKEMLDFCAKNRVYSDVQVFSIHDVDKVISDFKKDPHNPFPKGFRAVLKIEGEFPEESR